MHLGRRAGRAGREGRRYVVAFEDSTTLSGERLLVATGRRPRVDGLGLENVGIETGPRGIPVDGRMCAGEGIWAIGDVTGIWPLTYVGKYHGRIAAANILGEPREADYSAVPRVVFTHPQAAAVGAAEGRLTASIPLSGVPKSATYLRAWDHHPGFLTLVSDGEVLTGAYALGPEAGEWMQQGTVAIRARVPIAVLADTIQPFPTFSEAFHFGLAKLTSLVPGERVMSSQTAASSADGSGTVAVGQLTLGGQLPDFELPDHARNPRRLSHLVAADPTVIQFYRGWWCPKEQAFFRRLLALQDDAEVAYSRIVSVSVDSPQVNAAFRAGLGARWTFLSDPDRELQAQLRLRETTDTLNDPYVPAVVVIDPNLRVHALYNGYWYWGRPTHQELVRDLREITRALRADWEAPTP